MIERIADMSWQTVSLMKAGLAVGGIFLLVLLYFNARLQDAQLRRWVGDIALVLGILGAAAYVNFGAFHWHKYGHSIHYYDFYHYFFGAKYFPELGYTDLYDATVIADDEGRRLFSGEARLRQVRDLNTNLRKPWRDALEERDRIQGAFTEARWRDFKKDLDFFQTNMRPDHWRNVLQDLGFNGTPVWLLAGFVLANTVDSDSFTQMLALAWLDVLLMAGAFYLLYRAFGFHPLMLALLFFGINYTQRYQHMSGSLLRLDWLACLLAGIALLKMKRPCWAGFFLAYATLLRVFPLMYLAGFGFRFLYLFWRDRAIPRFECKLMCASAATALALFILTLFQAGGLDTWKAFADNIAPHSERLTVKRIAVIYPFIWAGEMNSGDIQLDAGAHGWEDFYAWRQHRLDQKQWLILPLRLLVLAAVVYLSCRMRPWETAILGLALVYCFMNPARYYYAQLLVLVPLLSSDFQRRDYLFAHAALYGMCFIMYAVDLTTRFYNFQQFLMSAFVGLILLFLLIARIREHQRPAQPAGPMSCPVD